MVIDFFINLTHYDRYQTIIGNEYYNYCIEYSETINNFRDIAAK